MDMSRLVCTDFPFVNIPLFWFCALCASLDNCQNNGCFYLGENMQYLYIIKCNEFHKIGIANDVEARLAQLSTGNPYQLTHDYILTGGVDWRLEARVDRNIPGYAIVKRGKNRSYLGYIRSTDLKDGLRPTVEEVENFLNSQGREHD